MVSLVRYSVSARPGTGDSAGRDPVAITNLSARTRRPPTVISRREAKAARPRRTSMPPAARTCAVSVAAIADTAWRTAAIVAATWRRGLLLRPGFWTARTP